MSELSFSLQLRFNIIQFIEGQKKRLKYLVLGPSAQRTSQLLSRTPRITLNVLSRTLKTFITI